MSNEIKNVIARAKADNRKGNYGVYNVYKQDIEYVAVNSEEYQEACKELAKALRV